MGTRGLTVVVSEGKHAVAQYGQWDHYPQGQGKTVLQFARKRLLTPEGRQAFKDKLKQCRFISDDELHALWKAVGADGSGLVNMEVADRFKEQHFQLSRDCGAQVLNFIWNAKDNVMLQDSTSFSGDSLFCEWAWVIDLDKNTLEAYAGFQMASIDPSERFAKFFQQVERRGEEQYHPIKLIKSWPLDELPKLKDFYLALRDPEDDSEIEDVEDDEDEPESDLAKNFGRKLDLPS